MDYKYTKEYFQIYTKIKQEFGQIKLFLGLFREIGRKSGKNFTEGFACIFACEVYLAPLTDVLEKGEWKELVPLPMGVAQSFQKDWGLTNEAPCGKQNGARFNRQ